MGGASGVVAGGSSPPAPYALLRLPPVVMKKIICALSALPVQFTQKNPRNVSKHCIFNVELLFISGR